MRFSSLLLAITATTATASVMVPRDAPNVQLPTPMTMLSIEDARNKVDLKGKTYNTTQPTAADILASGASTAQSADAASCSASPNIRIEWRSYSTSDRQAFVAAIKCLMNKPASGNFPPAANRYEDFARLHQMYTPNIHGNAKFYIWHRYFLWSFEQVLRAECGFDRAFPFWDETKDAGNFAKNDMFSQPYFGNLLPAQSNGQGWCINSGAFGGITLHIGPGTSNQNHCMTRTLNEQLTAQCSTSYMNLCNSRGTYAEMASCLELGPHAYGHNGIGGTMSDVSASPSDPVFWMHHSHVDRSGRLWQNMNTAVRTASINGNDAQGNPLTLDTMVNVGGIRPAVRIRDILNTLGGVKIGGETFCYRYAY